jgi:hypothetical protein
VLFPALIASQAASCAGVGSAKTPSNQRLVCGENAERAVVTSPSWSVPLTATTGVVACDAGREPDE